MHLRNLEVFCEVASRRSFSRAAEACSVSQSSASQAVLCLEERLGVQLLDRSKRPPELTAAGEVYYQGCRELLDAFRKVEDQVRNTANAVAGRVRIAAIYSAGLSEMESHVRRYEELYPAVDLRVDYLHPDEVYNRVREDEADFGLVSFPKEGGEFRSVIWQIQPMIVAVPASHRLAGRGSIPAGELDEEDFVAFTPELTVRKHVDRWLRHAKIDVTIVHEFDNVETIKRAVEIGAGVAILPSPAVQAEVKIGSLAEVRVEGVNWSRPLGIVHKRHKALSQAATRFLELFCPGMESTNGNGVATGSPVESRTKRNTADSKRNRRSRASSAASH